MNTGHCNRDRNKRPGRLLKALRNVNNSDRNLIKQEQSIQFTALIATYRGFPFLTCNLLSDTTVDNFEPMMQSLLLHDVSPLYMVYM